MGHFIHSNWPKTVCVSSLALISRWPAGVAATQLNSPPGKMVRDRCAFHLPLRTPTPPRRPRVTFTWRLRAVRVKRARRFGCRFDAMRLCAAQKPTWVLKLTVTWLLPADAVLRLSSSSVLEPMSSSSAEGTCSRGASPPLPSSSSRWSFQRSIVREPTGACPGVGGGGRLSESRFDAYLNKVLMEAN